MQTDIICDGIKDDEVVRYISERHHASVADVLRSCALQDGGKCLASDSRAVDLEENEIRIIRDLICMYHQKGTKS